MEDPKKRSFLKITSLTLLGGGLASLGLFSLAQTALFIREPKGKTEKLITDPNAKEFVYVDGFIVKIRN